MAVDGHSVVLTDLMSTTRTFVNGRRVERTELHPNDWITSASTS
ncbi:MAG: FHA domain-containing protein [Candidatus Methylomirabilales bacterium]